MSGSAWRISSSRFLLAQYAASVRRRVRRSKKYSPRIANPMMTKTMRALGSDGMISSDDWARTGAHPAGAQARAFPETPRLREECTHLPYKPMAKRIILVRHAQTTANLEHRWQGATDTSFTALGREQMQRLKGRLDAAEPRVAVASDLSRAVGTAQAAGLTPELDARWREPNVGAWEGLTFREIEARHPGRLTALLDGEDIALGGGERLSDVALRVSEAFHDLADRLDDGESAVVVSHGLALLALVAAVVGTRRPAPVQLMMNTGVTTFSINELGPQLAGYNDTSHLADDGPQRAEDTHVVLIRHGETPANVEERWQGHADWPLTDNGQAQARDLATTLPPLTALYSSPLQRAHHTALAVGRAQGTSVAVVDALKEIGFGAWENLTRAEIEATDPGAIEELRKGVDIVRGGNGETFTGVRDRMTEALGAIVKAHPGETVGVVTHGGASRAYLTGVLGIAFEDRNRLRSLGNTAYGRITYGPRGPRMAAWNAAPHLEAFARPETASP